MAAYILSVCNITNPGPNLAEYAQKSAAVVKANGGEYIVRGKPVEIIDGDLLDGPIVILLKFPDMDSLKGFYLSDTYQNECKPLREGTGEYHIAIYEDAA